MINTTFCPAGLDRPARTGPVGQKHALFAVALLAILTALTPLTSLANPTDASSANASPDDIWQSWGGQAHWRFNTDILAAMGLRIDGVSGASVNTAPLPGRAYHVLSFPARATGALSFHARGQKLYSLAKGALQYQGGFILRWPAGYVDLRGYALRAHAGGASEPFMMEVVDSHGAVLFLVDHSHYSLSKDQSELSLRNMNVRVSPQLAARMGYPRWAMRTIGSMDVLARVTVRAEQGNALAGMCSAPWPTEAAPGQVTNIQLFQKFSDKVQAMRCHLPGDGQPELGADCPYANSDGLVVIAPDSSLLNVGDTAVPWYRKFNSDRDNQSGHRNRWQG